jgi:hypothetical protein
MSTSTLKGSYPVESHRPRAGNSHHFSDEDDTATIHTHQRRIITKLLNNPAATKVEDLTFEGSVGAVFEIPAELISFRSGRRKLSSEQAQAAAANLERAQRAA